MIETTDWLEVPESVAMAYDCAKSINELKFRGGRIDQSAALAATAANGLLRLYFERMMDAVEEGHFDPGHILECTLALDMEYQDGEEKGGSD